MRILKALALGTIPIIGLMIVLCLAQVSMLIVQIHHDEAALASQAHDALDTVNAKCGVAQACGTLAEIDKTLTHSSDLIVQAQLAVHHADHVSLTESSMLPQWNAQISQTLANADATLATLDSSTKQLVSETGPAIADADSTLRTSTAVLEHFDALVASSDVLATLQHVNTTTLAIAESSQQADAILTDGRKEADALVAPKPRHWYSWIETGAQDGGVMAYWLYRLSH